MASRYLSPDFFFQTCTGFVRVSLSQAKSVFFLKVEKRQAKSVLLFKNLRMSVFVRSNAWKNLRIFFDEIEM